MVAINDNGLEFQAETSKITVGELLQEVGIGLGSEDSVFPPNDYKLTTGVRIFITRAVPVILWDGNEKTEYFSQRVSIRDFLAKNDIEVFHKDRVRPDLNYIIEPGEEIKITRVSEEIITEIKKIKFKTIYQDNPELSYGKTRLIKNGVNGQKEQIFKVIYENRKEVGRVLMEEKILKDSQPEIKEWGTKIVIGMIQQGGASWYKFEGGMFAASNVHPRGTHVRVISLENGKSVTVKINDWGPDPTVHPDRVIDLDAMAFKKLAPLWQGVIQVKVEEFL